MLLMIGLEWLEELISYSIASTYLKNEVPVSLLIVSEVETGKSQVLKKFSEIESVIVLTKATAYGFLRDYLPQIQSRQKRTIIIPDLVQLTMGLNPNLYQQFIVLFNALVEEGIRNVSTGNISITLSEDIRVNLISALPKKELEDKRKLRKWQNIGFMSRMLPVSFSYDLLTIAEIFEYLYRDEFKKEEKIQLKLPKEDIEVTISVDLAKELTPYAIQLARVTKTYGFRHQRQLQTLCKARALLNGRTEVIREDVERIRFLAHWINLDFNEVPSNLFNQ